MRRFLGFACCASAAKESRGAPEQRRLTVKITGVARAIEVIVQVVFFVGAFADVSQVSVWVQVTNQREPALASGPAVTFFFEPAVFDAGDHGESKHRGAGRFRPSFGMIEQLTPHAVFALILQK